MIRKISSMAIIILLVLFAGACSNAAKEIDGNQSEEIEKQTETGKLQVVTSIYPLYFFASEIGGDHAEVLNLIPPGIEPHDWTPKSKDMQTATDASLLLYHGAELESWMDSFLKGISKDSKVVVKEMSQGIHLITADGEEDSHHHDAGNEHEEHEHDKDGEAAQKADADEHDHGDHHHAIDPHTWVSPKAALILAKNVRDSLAEADPEHTESYEANYTVLKGKLELLDQQYEETLGKTSQKNIVVSHQAFGYLARDYGLKQVSIMGLNPDAEPLAQDILRIAKFVKEQNVRYIFFEELVSDQLAQTLASEAKVETMVLNPLEGLTKEQQKSGESYLTLMERNLQNLWQALK